MSKILDFSRANSSSSRLFLAIESVRAYLCVKKLFNRDFSWPSISVFD